MYSVVHRMLGFLNPPFYIFQFGLRSGILTVYFVLDCSRFWECEPQRGHCLLDCPPINPSENLYFNPTINICDWPENVDCEMSVDCDCEAWQACVLGKQTHSSSSINY